MPRSHLDEGRAGGPADIGDAAATRGEGAARRQVGKIGRLPLDGHQVLARIAIEARHAGQQAQRSICACTVTSSAVVGSSAMMSRGRHASAMAIITRWRMPPEYWCG